MKMIICPVCKERSLPADPQQSLWVCENCSHETVQQYFLDDYRNKFGAEFFFGEEVSAGPNLTEHQIEEKLEKNKVAIDPRTGKQPDLNDPAFNGYQK